MVSQLNENIFPDWIFASNDVLEPVVSAEPNGLSVTSQEQLGVSSSEEPVVPKEPNRLLVTAQKQHGLLSFKEPNRLLVTAQGRFSCMTRTWSRSRE